jgi:parallel beta helix pectate lyase-like protein/Big-like domain-containing protein
MASQTRNQLCLGGAASLKRRERKPQSDLHPYRVPGRQVLQDRRRRGLCILFVLAGFRLQAADLYVSALGCDENPGTSDQPLRTIARAHTLAAPGDQVIVMPGIYTDYTSLYGIRLRASGTAISPIVLHSQVKGAAIIDGRNAPDRNVGIYLQGDYTVIDGFEIRNNPNGGISIWGSGNQIINCEIHHNGTPASWSTDGKDGVYSDPSTSGNVYAANFIHDNGRTGSNLDHGLYLCGNNELVINNVLVGNAASGLQVAGYLTVTNLKVYNNVMAWNGTSGILLWQALNGIDIENNIFFQNDHYGLGSWDAHGSGVVLDHNLSFGNAYGDYNFTDAGSDYSYTLGVSITADPLLVNSTAESFDAHVNLGSPTMDAGLNLSSVFTVDKDGAPRPAAASWDVGPYSYPHFPTVSLIGPASNTTVFGSAVALSAVVAGISGPVTTQFELDGENLGPSIVAPPYQILWDTTTVSNGVHSLTAFATDLLLGGQTAANSVSLVVSNWTVPPTPTNLTFASTSGVISAPFFVTNDMIAQAAFTPVEQAGRAVYSFTVSSGGDYVVSALVDAPTPDANSFFINVDADPSDPAMIWDIPLTSGPESRTVSWRGNGTFDASQFVPAVFSLAAGTHQLIVCGREANCVLGTIRVVPAATLASVMRCEGLELTWSTNATGYVLESLAPFSGQSDWSAVTNIGSIDGDHYKLIVSPSESGRLYRLSSQ